MSSPNPEPPRPKAILVRLSDEMHADIMAYAKDAERTVEELVQDVLVKVLQTRIDNWKFP